MVASLLDLQEAARMRAKGIKLMRCRLAYLHDVADNDGLAGAGIERQLAAVSLSWLPTT